MSGPIARILLRIIAGILIGYMVPRELVDQITTNPDVETLVTAMIDALPGLAVWAATEIHYIVAKWRGWKT